MIEDTEETMTEETRELHINVRGRQSRALPDLLKQVIEAAQNGWIPKDDFNTIESCRMYSQNWFHVVLVRAKEVSDENESEDVVVVDYESKEDELIADLAASGALDASAFSELDIVDVVSKVDVVSNEPSVEERKNIMLERVEDAQTKSELELLSKTFEFEIPKEKKNFQQIKKFMRGYISTLEG